MKTKILLVTALLISGFAWGQQDCSKIEDVAERIKCLEKQIERLSSEQKKIDKKYAPYRLSETEYSFGRSSEVIIDFSKNAKVVSLPKKIRKGDFYRVVINNFNPNRYAVQINRKDTVLSKAIGLPTFGSFSLDALSTLTSSFTSSATISKIIDINQTGENVQPLEVPTVDLIENMTSSMDFDKMGVTNPEIITKTIINQEEENLKNIELVLGILALDFDSLKFGIYSYRIESLKDTPNYSDTYDFENALLEVSNLRKNLSNVLRKTTNAKDNFNKSISKEDIKTFLETNSSYKKLTNEILATYDTAIKKVNELRELMSADNAEKLLKSILFINKENEYKSFPIQFNGEINQLDITFIPKDSTSGLQQEKVTKLIFPINDREYWSLGTSFYFSNLSDERFSTITQINSAMDTIYTLQREDNIKREAGMAVMLRFGQKLDKLPKFGYHGSFGPGVSIEKNVRPRILFGLGISYGNKHNIVFDWGGILGYVDRRSSIVKDDAEYFEKPEATITKMMMGNYFSLGYMFKL